MGNTHGLKEGQILSAPQNNYTVRERPYYGPPVNYHFIAGGAAEDLTPMIDEYYRQGRRLLVFRKKPLSQYYVGIFRETSSAADAGCEHHSADSFCEGHAVGGVSAACSSADPYPKRPFQSKNRLSESSKLHGAWRHGVLTLWLHGQHRHLPKAANGSKRDMWVADPFCLADTLSHSFQHGERLICISMTTEQKFYSQKEIPVRVKIKRGVTKTFWCQNQELLPFDRTKRHTINAIVVELHYEVPQKHPHERFVYNVVAVPTTITHTRPQTQRLGHHLGLANVECDWTGALNHHLSQGWRLVDIFVDFRPPPQIVGSLAMTQFQYRYGSGDDETEVSTWNPIDTNTLWVFEKPSSREHDPTPVYEGQIVPFEFNFGENPAVCWDQTIRRFGSRGWELACFVERASFWPIKGTASRRVDTVVQSLLFFQRPINYQQ